MVQDIKTQTILIADDEPDILEIINYNLAAEGYKVLTAKNGNEAIDLAKSNKPDMIILDMMMPGKSGLEVCKILRIDPAFENTIILFLTALNDDSN
jgi:two-component system alkaline phosphatase synthesis response regulator PhoP